MKLIIGLGNPGDKYIKTRHNMGFMVLDKYVSSIMYHQVLWEINNKLNVEIIKTPDLILSKPLTYMNNSGQAAAVLANYFKIAPENIIVIHDDLDLMLGKIKVRMGGAAGGHHGVESVINALGSDQFIRVRLGIGNERSHSGEHHRVAFNAEHFVLESFMPNERSKVKHMLKQAVGAMEILFDKGLEEAQNQYN